MKPITFRWPCFIAVAVLGFAVPAAAQDTPPNILNRLDLVQLLGRASPGDHTRLSAHFTALGDRYAAEASRHRSMSRQFVGTAGRTVATGTIVHCRQLADLNGQSATTARELAAYHARLAAGFEPTPPRGAARLHGGAGAPEPTQHEVNASLAKARTPAQQGALHEYFLMRVRRYTSDASDHIRLAQTYRGTRIAHAAVHHDQLAERARAAAREAQATADINAQVVTWTQ